MKLAILIFVAAAAGAGDLERLSLTDSQVSNLLAAPAQILNRPPSDLLRVAIGVGETVEVMAERTPMGYVQGWINYTPIEIAKARTFMPKVLCVAEPENLEFQFCQDESWLSVQSDSRSRAIRVMGEVSNEEVDQIVRYIQSNEVFSGMDGSRLTVEKIWIVSRHRDCCVRLAYWTDDPGNSDSIRFKTARDPYGRPELQRQY